MKTTIQLTIFINSLFLFFSCSDINEVTFNGENDRTDVIYSLNIDKINEAAKAASAAGITLVDKAF